MASVFATLAVQWAGRTNRYPDHFQSGLKPHRVQKLYYQTTNFTLPERQPISQSPITTVIDIGRHLETKIAAFHAHASQAPLFPLFEGLIRPRGPKESFHLAAVSEPSSISHETDLFAGVKDQN